MLSHAIGTQVLWDGASWNALGTGSGFRKRPNGDDTCDMTPVGNRTSDAYPCYKSCRKLHGCSARELPSRPLVKTAKRCDCSTCVDDILFVENMLDKLEAQLCIESPDNRPQFSQRPNAGSLLCESGRLSL